MPRHKIQKPQFADQSVQQITYTAQRVGIFIDVQNMYYSAKNLFGSKVNFINVVKGAIRGRQLIRAIAYVVETPQQHEVRFLDALRLQGIELKERDLQVFSSGVKKADWDVGIAVDAIRMSDVLDVIVLVSGDGDYLPLVEYLQNKGRKVEVMAFRNTSSSRLVDLADEFTDLADESEDYLIRAAQNHLKQPHAADIAEMESADEAAVEAEAAEELAEDVEEAAAVSASAGTTPAPGAAPLPTSEHQASPRVNGPRPPHQGGGQKRHMRTKRTIL